MHHIIQCKNSACRQYSTDLSSMLYLLQSESSSFHSIPVNSHSALLAVIPEPSDSCRALPAVPPFADLVRFPVILFNDLPLYTVCCLIDYRSSASCRSRTNNPFRFKLVHFHPNKSNVTHPTITTSQQETNFQNPDHVLS